MAERAPSVEIRALGRVSVLVDGQRVSLSPDRTSIIALLLMAEGQAVSVDEIIEGVYQARVGRLGPDDPDPGRPTKGSIRVAIRAIRSAFDELPFELIVTHTGDRTATGGYALNLEEVDYDVEEFRRQLERARSEPIAERKLEGYKEALDLVKGQPFSGEPGLEQFEDYVRRIDLDVMDAERELYSTAVDAGRGQQFLGEIRRLRIEEPTNETWVALMMRAKASAGDLEGAENEFQEFEKERERKAGAVPSPALYEVFNEVLSGDVTRKVDQFPIPPSILTGLGASPDRSRYTPARTVGRADLVERMRAMTSDSDRLSYLVLVGQPGVGKSRVAYEYAQQAHAEGASVLHGRVEPDLQPPYGPFAEILRQAKRNAPGVAPRDLFGRSVTDLDRLVPGLSGKDPAASPDMDAATLRFRLLEGIVEWLTRMSQMRRVVVVFDDIHNASPVFLEALRYLAESPQRMNVAIVATARPQREAEITNGDDADSLDRSTAFDRHRLEVRRAVIDVHPLDLDATKEYIRSTRGVFDDTAEPVISQIFETSGGNPFYIESVVGALERRLEDRGKVVSRDDEWDVSEASTEDVVAPREVLDAVARRFSRLDETELRIARTAALMGPHPDGPVLAKASGVSLDAVDAVADRLRIDGLLVVDSDADEQSWRFTHDLLREALVRPLTPVARGAIHAEIGHQLGLMRGARSDPPADSLSYHLYRSLWLGDDDATDHVPDLDSRATSAVEWCETGTREAMRTNEYALAGSFAARHLAVLEQWDRMSDREVLDEIRRIELLIQLGRALRDAADPYSYNVLIEACLRAEGVRTPAEIATLLAAWKDASDEGDSETLAHLAPDPALRAVRHPVLLAEAARANTLGLFTVTGGGRSMLRGAWIRRALENEDQLDDRLVALLTARLAMENLYGRGVDMDARVEAAERAWKRAERGDLSRENKLRVLSDLLHVLWRADKLERRRELIDEMEELSDELRSPRWRWVANSFGFQLASDVGDMEEVDERLEVMEMLADVLKQPRLVQWTGLRRAVREAIRGDFEASEQSAIDGWVAATAANDADATTYLMGQLFTIHLHRNTLDRPPNVLVLGPGTEQVTLASLFEGAYQRAPWVPVFSAALIASGAVARDPDRTTQWLELWRRGGARQEMLNRADQDQLSAAAAVVSGAWFVGDTDAAADVARVLRGYEDRFIDNGTSYHGSAAYYLALAAETTGSTSEEADELFSYAVAQNRSINAPPFEALALTGWAEAIIRRPDGDVEAAHDHLLEATRIVSERPQLKLASDWIAYLEPMTAPT